MAPDSWGVREATVDKDLEGFGDPTEVWKGLIDFSDSVHAFSESELLDQYLHEWVAVHDRKVVSHAGSFDEVLSMVETENIPRESLIIRYVNDEQRVLIL